MRLRHRLPNAPSIFVGREREIEWLDLAIRRGPVVAIAGPGGMGKTALLLRTLSTRFAERVGHTVYFGIRPGEPTAQVRHDLVRVLAEVSNERVDLAPLAGDPEATSELAIDLAESAGLWVVLDDTHHADVEEMSELLSQLVTYARESRWLVTTRMEPPVAALRGQVLALSAMSEADLATLAKSLAPGDGTADLHRAVVASSGSPWLLQQYVATGDAGVELTRERIVGDLPDAIEPFLRTLALFRVPIGTDVLARLVEVPDAAMLDTLVRRGLVVRSEAGFALHDVVAQLLYRDAGRSPDDAARAERAANVLEATLDAELLVEAARLHLGAGALDALVALLEQHMDMLSAQAQVPRVFAVLASARDPRLARFQLRCAAELGNPTALGAVGRPLDPGPEEHLAWATTTYGKGEVDRARGLAAELRTVADRAGNGRVACEAALLEARCLLHQREPVHAARLLEALVTHDPGLVFRRDALRARCRAGGPDPTVDTALVELRHRGETLAGGIDGLLDVAWALHALGRREAADEVLDALLAMPRGGRASLLVSRNALLLRATIRLEAGDAALAGEIVASLVPYVRTTSLLRPFVVELDASRRLAIGDASGIADLVTGTIREAEAIDRGLTLRLTTLAERIALLQRIPPHPMAASVVVDPSDTSSESRALAAVRTRRAVRAGDLAVPEAPAVAVDAALAATERALVRGEPAAARERVETAVRESTRMGSRLLELEAREVELDVLGLVANEEALARAASALRELAVAMSSARARIWVDLAESFHDPAALERIAAHVDISPAAARRARALLGGAPLLDRVDRLVLDGWRARSPSLVVETVIGRDPRVEWQPGWGLDGRTRSVWLTDGRTIDLSTKGLLWRLVDALVARGGAATKEELVVGVWEERVYHPGRHDPRLHMSARKLREALEDDPGSPARILTTGDGYRLGGVVRRIAG